MGAYRALRPFLLDGVPQAAGSVLELTPRQARYRRIAGEIEPVAAAEAGVRSAAAPPEPPPPSEPASAPEPVSSNEPSRVAGPIRVSAVFGEGAEPPPSPSAAPAPEAPPRKRRGRRGAR